MLVVLAAVVLLLLFIVVLFSNKQQASDKLQKETYFSDIGANNLSCKDLPLVMKDVTVLNPFIFPYSATSNISYAATGKQKKESMTSVPDHDVYSA